MLFMSLILSALLLLIANWSARRARGAIAVVVWSSLAFLVVPFCLMFEFPPVAIQAILLCIATLIWRTARRGPSSYLAVSCGATLVAYGLAGIMVLGTEREYGRLRALYPYESMEGRLPTPRAVPGGTPLTPAAAEWLSRLEREIPEHANGYREFQLITLHEHAAELFINSPGFGIARMGRPSERGLAVNLRREPVPLQPGPRLTSMGSPGDLGRPPVGEEASLARMLDESIVDFANPRGFGYFKDRRHVAGFETHRFGQVPAPSYPWKVQALELVSLLLHDGPEVYVSSHLPRMDRLQGVPTRPPDRFEQIGLDALRRGEEIITGRGDDGLRMLGAVRSSSHCIACHGGERGALLGAFSYSLRPDGP